MKTYKVYEIINLLGTVEYVGETGKELIDRFYRHTKCKPGPGRGKFYQRQDVSIHEVARFNTRKEARELEGKLKLQYGLEWTEIIGRSIGCVIQGIKSRKLNNSDVEEIKQLYSTGQYTMKKIAEMYNVGTTTIRRIIRNFTYINETLS